MQKWNGRSCGKVPVRLIGRTWVATAPESRQFCLVFVDLFAGGSTAAAVTLDTVADESRKMADGVARSPSRLCSRDGKICCYETPWVRFSCLLAFVPCFLLFVLRFSFLLFFFLHPGMFIFSCPFVCAAAICYSQVRILYIVPVLSACVIWTLPRLRILLFFYLSGIYFFVALVSLVAFFFVVLSYPVR